MLPYEAIHGPLWEARNRYQFLKGSWHADPVTGDVCNLQPKGFQFLQRLKKQLVHFLCRIDGYERVSRREYHLCISCARYEHNSPCGAFDAMYASDPSSIAECCPRTQLPVPIHAVEVQLGADTCAAKSTSSGSF